MQHGGPCVGYEVRPIARVFVAVRRHPPLGQEEGTCEMQRSSTMILETAEVAG